MKTITDTGLDNSIKRGNLSFLNASLKELSPLLSGYFCIIDWKTRKIISASSEMAEGLEYFIEDRIPCPSFLSEELVHPEDQTKVGEKIRDISRGSKDEVIKVKYRIKNRKGTFRWIKTKIKILEIENNEIKYVSSFSMDVTEKEELKNELKKIKSELKESQNIAKVGSWEWEVGKDWMYWSQSLFEMFGYSEYPRVITYKDFLLNHLFPEEWSIVEIAVRNLIEHVEPFDIQHRVIRKDGKVIWIYCKGRILETKNGKPARMIGISQDITDRKLVESELKRLNSQLEDLVAERTRELSKSEERFRLVSVATNDAIWDWDILNNRLWWNDSFKMAFGYKGGENFPGFDEWFDKVHPEDKEKVRITVQNVMRNHKKFWSSEYRFLKLDGSYANILDRGYALYDEKGEVYRMIGSMMDLTQLKKTQQELRDSNKNLKRINTDLDNFVYTAFHDIKGPVSNIEGLVIALKDSDICKGEDTNILLDLIGQSTEKLKKTIHDLTEISKVGNDGEEKEDLSFSLIFEEVKKTLIGLINEKGASIKVDFSACNEIRFSAKNLKIILYNLLSNALKYSSPLRVLEVIINTELTAENTILRIKDNGLGLTLDQQRKIFGIFKRFHTHVQGEGIGLYVVKRIVENAGGRIGVESEINVGSSFSIYLPR